MDMGITARIVDESEKGRAEMFLADVERACDEENFDLFVDAMTQF